MRSRSRCGYGRYQPKGCDYGSHEPTACHCLRWGAMPADSVGFEWSLLLSPVAISWRTSALISMPSLRVSQAVRLYEMTTTQEERPPCFMIARDTMHQTSIAALEDLKSEGFEETVVPGPHTNMEERVCLSVLEPLRREESAQGRWAKGPSMDGKGSCMWRILSHWDRNQNHHSPTRACTARPNHSNPSERCEPNLIERAANVIETITGDQE